MQCSNICLRAGLVVLVFALIVSLVSTCPIPLVISLASVALIPATASGVSSCRNPSLNGHQLEFLFSVRMSTLPLATRLIFGVAWLTYYTRQPLSTIMDDQLVRRSIASKLKSFGQKVRQKFESAGRAMKQGFMTVAGNAIKHEAIMIGKGIKKVINFVKTTGAKVVKFGLKIAESALTLGAKLVGFIPGIGKPIGKAMEGVSKVVGFAESRLHVKLSGALNKGRDIMNKALGIMKYIP